MYQFINNGSVTSAKGFKAAGIHSGVKEKTKKLDLALIYSEDPCTVAGTYTINKVKSRSPYYFTGYCCKKQIC